MLRLIDANLNRLREGLRTLEDIARFILNDAETTRKLKGWRHKLVGDNHFSPSLLAAREVDKDVGLALEVPGEGERENLPSLARANFHRVEESLRVLEEFAKLPSLPKFLDPAKFKQARFEIYQIEKELISQLLRQEKRERLAGLYVILDTQFLKRRNEAEVARQAIKGGARAIQIRDKERSKAELLKISQELKQVCAESRVLFIINDYLDLALACDADGLHLGQEDLPIREARQLMPMDKLIGCSTHSLSEALQAQAEGADYISVGAIYPTLSKENAQVVGLETLIQIKKEVSLPIVAVGGINEANVESVIKAGAGSVAVISGVLAAEDIEEAAYRLTIKIGEAKGENKEKSPKGT